MSKLIDPNEAVDFMIANSAKYAEAEANKVFMEELRKTIKAEEMKNAEANGNGEYKTAVMQEREAYASPRYKEHLQALRQAVQERERLRWLLIACQERIAFPPPLLTGRQQLCQTPNRAGAIRQCHSGTLQTQCFVSLLCVCVELWRTSMT